MYDLIKFTRPEYVESVLDGKLYMNTIGYFQANGFENQRDIFEGMAFYEDPNNSAVGLGFEEEVRNVMVGNIGLTNEGAKYCNIASFYRLNRYGNQVEKVEKGISDFGEVAIHIFDVHQFLSQIMQVAKEMRDFYWCAGDVNYYDKNAKDAPRYAYDCFCKVNKLAYQREWRLAVLNQYTKLKQIAKESINEPYLEPYTFSIGNIRRIARVIPTDELLKNQAKWFPQCTLVNVVKPAKELTPELADKWFAQGIVSPRSALDGAYWGNCDKNNIDDRAELQKLLMALADGRTRISFSIG